MVESILNFGKDNFTVIMHEAGLIVGQNILNYLVVKGHDLCNLPWNVHQNIRVEKAKHAPVSTVHDLEGGSCECKAIFINVCKAHFFSKIKPFIKIIKSNEKEWRHNIISGHRFREVNISLYNPPVGRPRRDEIRPALKTTNNLFCLF